MEYQGKNKSPYYGVWQSSLLLIAVPIVLFFFFKGIFDLEGKLTSEQIIHSSLFFGCGVASIFQLSCVLAGLFKGTFVVVVERLKELFGNLPISFRFAMKHYWENVKSEGIVFWIYFDILTITLILCCYGGYHYFSKLLGF